MEVEVKVAKEEEDAEVKTEDTAHPVEPTTVKAESEETPIIRESVTEAIRQANEREERLHEARQLREAEVRQANEAWTKLRQKFAS